MKKLLFLVSLLMLLCSFSMKEIELQLEKGYEADDLGHYEEAIKIYEKGIRDLPPDSLTWISDLYSCLTVCYLRLGQLDKSLMCGEKSLKIDEKLGDKSRISSSLNNVASLLLSANRFERAEEYLLRSISLERELKDDEKLAVRLGMLAEVYTKMKNPGKALPLAKEALELDRKGGREKKAAIRMSQYGNALVCTKRPLEAMTYLTEALRLHQKYNNYPSEAITLINLGMAEYDLKHYSKAKYYLSECIEKAEKRGLIQPLMTAHLELSKQLNEEKDPSAYNHLVKYNVLKDSINNKKFQQEISEQEVKYETKQKEQELEKKELLIQRQRFVYIGLSIVLVLTIAVIIFLIVVVRLKNQNMELKDRFMQAISHDLKNPTIAQQKSLHILSKAAGTLSQEEMQRMVCQLAEDADSQVNLLYSLLDWAGLHTGRLRYTPIMLNLSTLVEDVAAQLRIQATVKNIHIVLSLDDEGHMVLADRQMVEAMVRNLLSNALKFSHNHSEVRLSVKGTTIECDDDGIGFGNVSKEKGTGLGLNLVRKLAKINKASFVIEPKSDRGTIATIVFNKE